MKNTLFLLVLISFNCFAQNNWTSSNSGLPADAYVNDFAQTSNGDIYIIVNSSGQGQLLKSSNNGSSWTTVTTSGLPTGGWAGSLFAKGNSMFLGTGGLGSFLYTSTDNGQNWTSSNIGLPTNAYVNDFVQTSNGDIYIIVNVNGDGQLLKSTNNGSSWTTVTTSGLPTGGWAGSLFVKDNSMFLGSGGLGSFLYKSTAGSSNIEAVAFYNSVLLFPNPNKGQINITSSDNIDFIQISNIEGQIVYEQRTNNNQISFHFDGAGVYFVTISNGKYTTTQKLIVE